MKPNSRMISLVFLLTCGLLGASQQQPAVPIEEEPHHKIVFKNDYVRVIDATFPPGYVTLNHTHEVDNVAIMISPGREGAAAERGIGRASFSKGGYSHSVTNPGPGIMRFIDVEILKSDHPGADPELPPGHTLELENDRVRVYRVRLDAGGSLNTHTHSSGWMEVTVSGEAGAGAFTWQNAGQDHPLRAGGAALEVVELQPR